MDITALSHLSSLASATAPPPPPARHATRASTELYDQHSPPALSRQQVNRKVRQHQQQHQQQQGQSQAQTRHFQVPRPGTPRQCSPLPQRVVSVSSAAAANAASTSSAPQSTVAAHSGPCHTSSVMAAHGAAMLSAAAASSLLLSAPVFAAPAVNDAVLSPAMALDQQQEVLPSQQADFLMSAALQAPDITITEVSVPRVALEAPSTAPPAAAATDVVKFAPASLSAGRDGDVQTTESAVDVTSATSALVATPSDERVRLQDVEMSLEEHLLQLSCREEQQRLENSAAGLVAADGPSNFRRSISSSGLCDTVLASLEGGNDTGGEQLTAAALPPAPAVLATPASCAARQSAPALPSSPSASSSALPAVYSPLMQQPQPLTLQLSQQPMGEDEAFCTAPSTPVGRHGQAADFATTAVSWNVVGAGAGAALEATTGVSIGAAVAEPAAVAAAGLSAKIASIVASSAQHFSMGGVAGAVGAAAVYPLDTVKTRMQAQTKRSSKGGPLSASSPPGDKVTGAPGAESASAAATASVTATQDDSEAYYYKNELDCFRKMVQEEGVASLYRGIGPQLLGIAPEKAVKLAVNELLLAMLESVLPGTRVWLLELIAGGGGGACQVLFTNPVEAVKVRMQTHNSSAQNSTASSHNSDGAAAGAVAEAAVSGSASKPAEGNRSTNSNASDSQALREDHTGAAATSAAGSAVPTSHQSAQPSTLQVVRELGLRGLYNGTSVTLARDVPSTALFFACYAYLNQMSELPGGIPMTAFLSACLASAPAALLVTPMDVVKTRMQLEPQPGQSRPENAWQCARQLVEEEGVGALFKGATARVLRVSPQFGITLLVYDYLLHHM